MFSATKANVRTAVAANQQGEAKSLSIAFLGGSVMGLCVASLGLMGLGGLYYYFGGDPHTAHQLLHFFPVLVVVSLPKAQMLEPTWLARLKRVFPRMIRAIQE